MSALIRTGDCREILKTLPDESVQCVVTSPPYWGLRDYGVKGQVGLEPSPKEYVCQMVEIFREVRRVLRSDGTCWLNLGDTYAGSASSGGPSEKQVSNRGAWHDKPRPMPDGLKPKDLIGVPWEVALALRNDGWWLRSDIVWAKPNPMPESVTDRPARSHEYIFLLTKSARYYYDHEAVRRPMAESSGPRLAQDIESQNGSSRAHGGIKVMKAVGRKTDKQRGHSRKHAGFNDRWDAMSHEEQVAMGANLRDVWNVATQGFPDAHFATFPPKLIEPCVKAGTSEKGQCSECGTPWVRVVERESGYDGQRAEPSVYTGAAYKAAQSAPRGPNKNFGESSSKTLGWRAQCSCDAPAAPQTVLDPFAGAGTTGLVATRLDRNFIGIELNEQYAEMARRRILNDAPLFMQGEVS